MSGNGGQGAAPFLGIRAWGPSVCPHPLQLLRVCLCRESNVGVPGVWVFHVGTLENVEPGDVPGAVLSPAPHGTDDTSVPTELLAQPGSRTTSPHPHPALLSIVPSGLPASPLGQEWSPRLHSIGDAPQGHPVSYSSGQHGVGVEEDVHFNTNGERGLFVASSPLPKRARVGTAGAPQAS